MRVPYFWSRASIVHLLVVACLLHIVFSQPDAKPNPSPKPKPDGSQPGLKLSGPSQNIASQMAGQQLQINWDSQTHSPATLTLMNNNGKVQVMQIANGIAGTFFLFGPNLPAISA
jgi:hypothetical protein